MIKPFLKSAKGTAFFKMMTKEILLLATIKSQVMIQIFTFVVFKNMKLLIYNGQ